MFGIIAMIIGGVLTQEYLNSNPQDVQGTVTGAINQPFFTSEGQVTSIASPTMNGDFLTAIMVFSKFDSPFWKDPEWGGSFGWFYWVFFIPLAVGIVWGFVSLFGSAIQGIFSK
jgi:hypothetical protein